VHVRQHRVTAVLARLAKRHARDGADASRHCPPKHSPGHGTIHRERSSGFRYRLITVRRRKGPSPGSPRRLDRRRRYLIDRVGSFGRYEGSDTTSGVRGACLCAQRGVSAGLTWNSPFRQGRRFSAGRFLIFSTARARTDRHKTHRARADRPTPDRSIAPRTPEVGVGPGRTRDPFVSTPTPDR
jgi:hypothetical protein